MTAITTVPNAMTATEREAFIRFVAKAGEVNVETLPGLVDRALALITVHRDDALIGTAAIKRPNVGYRRKVFTSAGVADAAHLHQFELGWVHVATAYRGQGDWRDLMDAAVAASDGLGVYATTKVANMHAILPRYDFSSLGADYISKLEPGASISLFVRPA